MHFTPSPERNPSPVQRTSAGSEHTGSKIQNMFTWAMNLYFVARFAMTHT